MKFSVISENKLKYFANILCIFSLSMNEITYGRCLIYFRTFCWGKSSIAYWREIDRLLRLKNQHLCPRSKRSTRNSLSLLKKTSSLLKTLPKQACYSLKQLSTDQQTFTLLLVLYLLVFYGHAQCVFYHVKPCFISYLMQSPIFYPLYVHV